MDDLSIPYLGECLEYIPATGDILWRERPRSHFKNEAAFKNHQRTRSGRKAGCVDSSTGYLVVGLRCKLLYAHRIAWAISHGEWPKMIDHIDGDKLNNRLANLRSVTQMENSKNTAIGRHNKSGSHGVSFAKREGRWRARLMTNYRDIHLGYFRTKEEAIAARARAERDYGFHPNHGRS